MIATIDQAGRLVIPKPVRDAMGLRPGVPLDITYADGKIEIEYAPVEWEVVMENGFPVLRCADEDQLPKVTDEQAREMLEAVRDEGVAGRV